MHQGPRPETSDPPTQCGRLPPARDELTPQGLIGRVDLRGGQPAPRLGDRLRQSAPRMEQQMWRRRQWLWREVGVWLVFVPPPPRVHASRSPQPEPSSVRQDHSDRDPSAKKPLCCNIDFRLGPDVALMRTDNVSTAAQCRLRAVSGQEIPARRIAARFRHVARPTPQRRAAALGDSRP